MSKVDMWAQQIADAVAATVGGRCCQPTATYRLQFAKGAMGFRDAAEVVPYLAELGISHLYASPSLKARAGSKHGYDVVDYSQLNPELGGDDDYRTLVEALHRHGMGQILDTVPNHMSTAPAENPWWDDVLENGPGSPKAACFDIDWRPIKEELRNKVLLPVLAEQYGKVLESGDLRVEFGEGAFRLRYHEMVLPLEPRTYHLILGRGLAELKESQPAEAEDLRELESILTAIEHLPDYAETEPSAVAERQREKEVIKDRLARLVGRAAPVAEHIARNVAEINGTPNDPASFDQLDKLLDAQVYRLSHWKAADDEINYRRFFDVNELAAVCMEEPAVFAESHRLVFDLLARGDVDGLRIDHIDGLYDPLEYLRHLQAGYLRHLGRAAYQRMIETAEPIADAPADAPADGADAGAPPWERLEPLFLARATARCFTGRDRLPLYVVVEKILSPGEVLPAEWLVAGTTGYDFLHSVGGLFVDTVGLAQVTRLYTRFTDQRADFREVAYQSKLLMLDTSMASSVQLLAHRLSRISERHRPSRDFTLNALRIALRGILAAFPVYRTYIRENAVSERDRQAIGRAVAQVKRRNPATDAAVFDFIRDVLLLQAPPDLDESIRDERQRFVGRFQQVSGPAMAKGVEDTAFYRYFPLSSLNDVGGDPAHGPTPPEEFHRHNSARQKERPLSLLATTTHDTKRTEDTRARISVLSEVPHLWRAAVNRWARLNRRHRQEADGQPAPSRNDEYLFYQTLVGVWPPAPAAGESHRELTRRMQVYMEKATREAKIHTSWISPVGEYDRAVREFVDAVLDDHPKNRFLADFCGFHRQVVNWGLYSALSQLLLKLASPGVPDIYGGQEVWDFSLVDPDNRRPVDFAEHAKMLARLRKAVGRKERSLAAVAGQLARDPSDPRTKLFLTWRTLQFRRRQADLFRSGEYIPLEVEGAKVKHVCAFARRLAGDGPDSRAGDCPDFRPGDCPDFRPSENGTVPFGPPNSQPQLAVVVAPRLLAQLTPLLPDAPAPPPLGPDVWGDTRLVLPERPGPLTNVFTGQTHSPDGTALSVAAVLADFPVALLTTGLP
jgi:(1->4)-alpha-D-glucan 1-alpha-D-glucosylmutase